MAFFDILRNAGAKYFLILQPNHYVVGNKAISAGDLKMMSSDFGWDESDTVSWRYMQQNLKDLEIKGIKITDFNEPFIFTGSNKVLVDTCCHLNKYGYAILAAEVALVIYSQCD